MKINKVCRMNTCQKRFTEIPSTAKFQNYTGPFTGWYWQCDCHTTMFLPTDDSGNIKEVTSHAGHK